MTITEEGMKLLRAICLRNLLEHAPKCSEQAKQAIIEWYVKD